MTPDQKTKRAALIRAKAPLHNRRLRNRLSERRRREAKRDGPETEATAETTVELGGALGSLLHEPRSEFEAIDSLDDTSRIHPSSGDGRPWREWKGTPANAGGRHAE